MGTRHATVCVSLRAELPWVGWRARHGERAPRTPGPFASACAKALAGSVVERMEKLGTDRVLALRFVGGQSLCAELMTHGANLILLDGAGRIVGTARHPRGAHARLHSGEPYRPPAVPAARLVPFGESPERIDAVVDEALREGEDLLEAVRRRLLGIGSSAARLVIAESARTGRSPGEVLATRLQALERGEADPVLAAAETDPLSAADAGLLDRKRIELFPWDPDDEVHGCQLLRGSDAAATAALYYEALEREAWVRARGEGLLAVLRAELRRLASGEDKVAEDLAGFDNPDKHRLWGEALLAGLTVARREGNAALVPDPYDADGRDVVVPAPAHLSLPAAAERHFQSFRRARRGIEAARRRMAAIRSRAGTLGRLLEEFSGLRGIEAANRLAGRMRDVGIPVDMEPAPRRRRETPGGPLPRLEGVRMFTSSEGWAILVGRTGKDNDRLTFRLASPEDFWLHAGGAAGAHVIVRNPRRDARPPQATLQEAAEIAAWYSDARDSQHADVHWTRRKNVRRLRGGPRGRVALKRFETIRVRPRVPDGERGTAES